MNTLKYRKLWRNSRTLSPGIKKIGITCTPIINSIKLSNNHWLINKGIVFVCVDNKATKTFVLI